MYFNRFLATGDTFGTIAYSYRQGHKTVRRIVYETCDAIWKRLSPLYLSSNLTKKNGKKLNKNLEQGGIIPTTNGCC